MHKCDGCGKEGSLSGRHGDPAELRRIVVSFHCPPVGDHLELTYHAASLECRNRAIHRLREEVFARA